MYFLVNPGSVTAGLALSRGNRRYFFSPDRKTFFFNAVSTAVRVIRIRRRSLCL